MKKHKRRSRTGFTLIEVLIVVVILGILASTVLPQFTAASSDAQQSALEQDLHTLRSQIQMYRMDHGAFPALASTLSTDFKNAMLLASDAKGNVTGTGTKKFGPYLVGQIPANPFTGGRGIKIVTAPLSAATPDETLMDGTDKVGWIYSPTEGAIKGNNQGLAADGVTPLSSL